MYEPMSGLGVGDIYQGAARTTAEATNPPANGGIVAQHAANTGVRLPQQIFGIELPVLIGCAILAVVLLRYYE